jgi:hypothetical protein
MTELDPSTASFRSRWEDLLSSLQLPVRIAWRRLPGLRLQAYVDGGSMGQPHNPYGYGLREQDMDPIQAWCGECQCGSRTSFNTFEFRSEAHITMFLLRWSS